MTFEDANDILSWDFPKTLNIYSLNKVVNPLSYNANLSTFLKLNFTNYDVIIIEGLWLYHSFCTANVFKWFKKNKNNINLPKIYCMPHGMLDPWFQNNKSRKLKAIRNYFYWHLVEKYVVNNVDGILFTCEEELLLARTTFSDYHPNKEINIGYGIEAPPGNNIKFNEAFEKIIPMIKDKRYFLFLSRIDYKKGVDLLIEAYNLISKDNPNLPHLVIAGPNDSKYAKDMILLAKGNPKIHFTGMLKGSEKWGALYGCEAFILPSHQENFGIAVAEALAYSKPVLISNKVNIYREIEEGGAGIINQDTLDGTVSNLTQLLDLNTIERQKMCELAHLVFLKHFNIENAAKKLVQELNILN